jgi:general secretion pathway protein G
MVNNDGNREPACNLELRQGAFTLIELLVVLAIVALLLSLSVPRYFQSIAVSKETILADNLRITRETIDKFYGDTQRYPDSLQELVDKKYLRALPFDPITESSATWVVVPPADGASGKVYEIYSGASGAARDGRAFVNF